MKPRAVLDASTVVGGLGWRAESHRVLVALARKRFASFASTFILEEWATAAVKLEAENEHFADQQWRNTLNWLREVTDLVASSPLGKQRFRDAKDDPYLAAAISARADFLVTRDHDQLAFEKPFGVKIVEPREFLRWLA